MDVCWTRSAQASREPSAKGRTIRAAPRPLPPMSTAPLLSAVLRPAFAPALLAAALLVLAGSSPARAQEAPAEDPTVFSGPPDGGPDHGVDGGDVEIASRTDSARVGRAIARLLGEPAAVVALRLGPGVGAWVPASARSIAVFHPARRPLGSPVLALACTAGSCGVAVRPTLLVDRPTQRPIALPRQGAALGAGRTLVVRLRLTAAQRAAVAGSARPRLRLHVVVVDHAGVRSTALRTVPVAAPVGR